MYHIDYRTAKVQYDAKQNELIEDHEAKHLRRLSKANGATLKERTADIVGNSLISMGHRIKGTNGSPTTPSYSPCS